MYFLYFFFISQLFNNFLFWKFQNFHLDFKKGIRYKLHKNQTSRGSMDMYRWDTKIIWKLYVLAAVREKTIGKSTRTTRHTRKYVLNQTTTIQALTPREADWLAGRSAVSYGSHRTNSSNSMVELEQNPMKSLVPDASRIGVTCVCFLCGCGG